MSLRVSQIKIRNILGIEDLEITPGALTIIEGQNATGKTSIIEAIKAALGGGHDASLIRNGAESGEVVLVLENGQEITRTINEDRSDPVVKDPKYGKLRKPQTVIDKLIDALSFNPVAFLTAPAKKRAEWLLEMLPLELDPREIQEAAGILLDKKEVEGNPLDVIARVRQRVYDLRTGVNRIADEKHKTINTLETQLPEKDIDDVQSELEEAHEKLELVVRDYRKKSEALKTTLQENIAALSAGAQEKIDEIKTELQRDIQAAREHEEKLRACLERDRDPIVDKTKANMVRLEEQSRQAERGKTTLEMVQKFHKEELESNRESERLTESLKRLDDLKLRLIQSLPIRGLEIRDGEVIKDGIPFDRVNRAKQVAVALQIAKLRAGEVGLVCVDNLECLDAETFAAFEKAALKSGLQLVVTRVTEGPLKITTLGDE